MKGLDALAKACEPAQETTPDNPAVLQLTDDQIDKIASRMIEKLQNQQPEAENEDEQAEDPADPGEEVNDDDIS